MELNSDWGKNIKAFLGNDHGLIVRETEELPEYLDLKDKRVQMPLFKIKEEEKKRYDVNDYLYDQEATKFAWVKITNVIILCRHVEVYKGRSLIRIKMIVKVKPIDTDLGLDTGDNQEELTCRPFHTTIELYAFQLPKHHYYKHMYHIKWGHKRKLNSERVDEGKVNDWEYIEYKNLVKFRKDKSLVLFPNILTYYHNSEWFVPGPMGYGEPANDLVLIHETVSIFHGRRGFNKGTPVSIGYDGFEEEENNFTAYPGPSPVFTWCPLQAYLKMFHDRKKQLEQYYRYK